MPERKYDFRRSDRGLLVEIYFPYRAAYQGNIFDSLEKGVHEDKVRHELKQALDSGLLLDLHDYQRMLDPDHYQDQSKQRRGTARQQRHKGAEERIALYQSPFTGWSLYTVHGNFWNPKSQELVEEATQVIRIIFRFRRRDGVSDTFDFDRAAEQQNCRDVTRAIILWTITDRYRIDSWREWHVQAKETFLQTRNSWNGDKQAFAEQYFTEVSREVVHWLDDCDLFIFGYLVRSFARHVLEREKHEQEIWVTSLTDLNINVIERITA